LGSHPGGAEGPSSDPTGRNVSGILFADYVRMIRAAKRVAWTEFLDPRDRMWLTDAVDPAAWYPMESFDVRYIGFVGRREERMNGSARVFRGRFDDGSFDRENWARRSTAEKIDAVWDMVLEHRSWRGESGEPRLQRSVCRVERRRR
jgi:hypothetical protein